MKAKGEVKTHHEKAAYRAEACEIVPGGRWAPMKCTKHNEVHDCDSGVHRREAYAQGFADADAMTQQFLKRLSLEHGNLEVDMLLFNISQMISAGHHIDPKW